MEVKRIQSLALKLEQLKEIPAPLNNVLVKEIAEAACEWGLFQITDHNISETLIKSLKEVGEEFFGLPEEEKEAFANDPSNDKFDGEVTENYSTEMLRVTEKVLEVLSEGLGLEKKGLKSELEACLLSILLPLRPPPSSPATSTATRWTFTTKRIVLASSISLAQRNLHFAVWFLSRVARCVHRRAATVRPPTAPPLSPTKCCPSLVAR
ncbi:hypothetical protein V8G54_031514 [Vigna mungo]|uniref:Non-haem dioxygenase N-terminal domain-containing protein n=1 Tax=Vigna mungo TaxID=3915 RepID=A0AAQ3RFV7_VIGMU